MGYIGYSKSVNAANAEEEEGRLPATKFAKWLREKGYKGATSAFVKDVVHTDEWHHTSCKYNMTDYFCKIHFFENRKKYRKALEEWKKRSKIKNRYFKCWNVCRTSDPRRWDWKITPRWGNHCMSMSDALKEIKTVLAEVESTEAIGKVKQRIRREKLEALDNIKKALLDV